MLYSDDLVLMSEALKGLRNKFLKWKEAFENKSLKVNLGNTRVMVSDRITNDGLFKSKLESIGLVSFVCAMWKVDPQQICWIVNGGWKMYKTVCLRKCEVNIEEAVEQEERISDKVETKRVCISR